MKEAKESKAMMKKEVDFMKKKGAPKSMIKHEMAEAKAKGVKMAKGGMAKKPYATGGAVRGYGAARKPAGGCKGA